MTKQEFCKQLIIRCEERIDDLGAKLRRNRNIWSQTNVEWHEDLLRINVSARETAMTQLRRMRLRGITG